MVLKSDQQRMKALLKETITLLCKNGLHYKSEFCVEALIGITLDHNDVFLVNIKETIRDELKAAKELSQMADADAALEAPSPTSTETDRAAPRRRRHSGREDRRTRTVNQTDSFTGEGECTENVSPAGQESYELSEADQLSECVKQEENGEWSSSRSEQTQAENLSDTAYKRSHQEDVEYSSQHTPKKRRYSNHNDEVSHSEDDDVVFIKDEPLSDSELQQVTLGIAHAQNQAMHQYGYQGTPNQAAIPLSGLSAEPLPGCSNWSMPAGSGDINTPVSLGAPPGGGDQGASGSNVSSQIDDLHGMASDIWHNPSVDGFITSQYLPAIACRQATPGQEEHVCNICSKVYRSRSTLVRHKKDHMGTFAKCTACTLHFRTMQELVNHKIKKHHSKHVCLKCAKSFSDQTLLTVHMITDHPGESFPTTNAESYE